MQPLEERTVLGEPAGPDPARNERDVGRGRSFVGDGRDDLDPLGARDPDQPPEPGARSRTARGGGRAIRPGRRRREARNPRRGRCWYGPVRSRPHARTDRGVRPPLARRPISYLHIPVPTVASFSDRDRPPRRTWTSSLRCPRRGAGPPVQVEDADRFVVAIGARGGEVVRRRGPTRGTSRRPSFGTRSATFSGRGDAGGWGIDRTEVRDRP